MIESIMRGQSEFTLTPTGVPGFLCRIKSDAGVCRNDEKPEFLSQYSVWFI
jgi:hypothetical protein